MQHGLVKLTFITKSGFGKPHSSCLQGTDTKAGSTSASPGSDPTLHDAAHDVRRTQGNRPLHLPRCYTEQDAGFTRHLKRRVISLRIVPQICMSLEVLRTKCRLLACTAYFVAGTLAC